MLLYKKALLSIKTRFKNDYLAQRDTSKILMNIAGTELISDNVPEALKYYEHALSVLQNYKHTTKLNKASEVAVAADTAKVHIQIANIYQQVRDLRKAFDYYQGAVDCLERSGLSNDEMAYEARKGLSVL